MPACIELIFHEKHRITLRRIFKYVIIIYKERLVMFIHYFVISVQTAA